MVVAAVAPSVPVLARHCEHTVAPAAENELAAQTDTQTAEVSATRLPKRPAAQSVGKRQGNTAGIECVNC
jgi:hypothetical protein